MDYTELMHYRGVTWILPSQKLRELISSLEALEQRPFVLKLLVATEQMVSDPDLIGEAVEGAFHFKRSTDAGPHRVDLHGAVHFTGQVWPIDFTIHWDVNRGRGNVTFTRTEGGD